MARTPKSQPAVDVSKLSPELLGQLTEVLRALGVQPEFATPAAVAEAVAPKFDAKVHAEAHGYALNTGRVYLTADAVKAAGRVVKTGTPEIVATSGGRSTHVLVFRTDTGDAAVQNLRSA